MPITQERMAVIVQEALRARSAFDSLASLLRDTLDADLAPSAKCALLATALEAVEQPQVTESLAESAHIALTREGNRMKARRQRERKAQT